MGWDIEAGYGPRRLYVSESTVEADVSRLPTKLDVTNRVQVAITVRDAGLT